MSEGDGKVDFVIRPSEFAKFGAPHCVHWSDDDKYIFSGDITGCISVFDAANRRQLAKIEAHKDIVHDMSVAGTALFSCSADQTIAVFDLNELSKDLDLEQKSGDIEHSSDEAKIYKATQLRKNEKYPFWKLQSTQSGQTLFAGDRKLWSFKFSGFEKIDELKEIENESYCKLFEGPKISDNDYEHIQSIHFQKGLVVISRRDLQRCKIFETSTGKQTAKKEFKAPVKSVQFVFDNEHCVVCTQKQEAKRFKSPIMHLWNYKS